MNSIIRPMTPKDKNSVLEMMRVFYASPAVFTNGSDDIFRTDIENCINDNPYLEGYIFEVSGEIQGYGMIAKSFSTEFGRPCMWIEDIYIKESCRGPASEANLSTISVKNTRTPSCGWRWKKKMNGPSMYIRKMDFHFCLIWK